ncbi:uncharacterized protein F5891DRAFT_1195842 [Suillus fuscotomentosus]|uniref:Uncharacterized protein n=1 Tax=Suillus fuscotomentosus TaxID=1912939 RepID=A0AAD4DU09_9AGAM|nr:uncharacterized protein F5891DRAFT_1195842 [Suillus fuscotomentosus]KAG1893916.1 hypothetical protein F5891DRAFT_1195842 [Suillus fuscotomentosus]
MEHSELNLQQEISQFDYLQAQQAPLPVPEPPMIIPGPLVISDSAIALWNTATQTAQGRAQDRCSALQYEPIPTTEQDKCWLTLLALQKEQELEDTVKWVENAWKELVELPVGGRVVHVQIGVDELGAEIIVHM